MPKPPADKEYFEEYSGLLVEVIADTCLNERGISLVPGEQHTGPTLEQCRFFVEFADLKVRWHYANDKNWRKKIHSRDYHAARDFVYAFVGHWADAFVADPAAFIEKHPIKALCGSPD